MGLTDIFTSKSNLSGLLSPPRSLYVSNAIHQAIVDVNEKGSEAAAATGDTLDTFYLDRYFLG